MKRHLDKSATTQTAVEVELLRLFRELRPGRKREFLDFAQDLVAPQQRQTERDA
jgi:hypothetical protein